MSNAFMHLLQMLGGIFTRTTINDIAKACNVSPATVSRVFSGKSNVKKDTADLITKTAAALGYEHKPSEKSQKPEYKRIMLITGDITNQFYMRISQSFCRIMSSHGYKVAIYYSDNNSDLEEDYIRFAQIEHYDGIVMLTAIETKSLINLLSSSKSPVVLVNRSIRSIDLNTVCIDNFRGGYIATNYLIGKGHKKIAHLSGPFRSTASNDRMRGYMAALEDAHLSVADNAIFEGNLQTDAGEKFVDYFLENLSDYTAVFCANDIMAVAFAQRLAKQNLKIPDDVSIISFDDTPIATQGNIKLTTVSQDPSVMGSVTADIMLNILSSHTPVTKKIVFPPVLNERDSVKELC